LRIGAAIGAVCCHGLPHERSPSPNGAGIGWSDRLGCLNLGSSYETLT